MPVDVKTRSLAQIKRKKKVVGFIGGYLIDDGALTLEELDHGLLRQINLALQGRAPRLGQILIELGYITTAELELALKRHDRDKLRASTSRKKRKK